MINFRNTYRMRQWRRILLPVCLWFTAAAGGAEVGSKFVWVGQEPHLIFTVAAAEAVPETTLKIAVEITDAKGEIVWETVTDFILAGAGPWHQDVLLEKIVATKQQHGVKAAIRHFDLGIDYREELFFNGPDSTLWSYGVRRCGILPDHKVHLTLALPGVKGKDLRKLPVSLSVFDRSENSILSRIEEIQPQNTTSHHALDITPADAEKSGGPYRVDAEIQSDVFGIYFNASRRFPYANTVIPVSSWEHGDDARWFAAEGDPKADRTLHYYYSRFLAQLQKSTYPEISYDSTNKHSGRQSLHIRYTEGAEATAWGRQLLPGKPTDLLLWVHGNNTGDRLVVYYEDFINFTLPAWQRNANFEAQTICTLNFTGWRRFRVPVLGDGLQQTGIKGSSPNIDAPVGIKALGIVPERPLKKNETGVQREIWVDDLAVETQAEPADLLTMEVESNHADGRLRGDSAVHVSIGNALRTLEAGRLTMTARDGLGAVVWTAAKTLAAEGAAFTLHTLELGELAAKNPRGPVSVDIVYSDPARPGLRVAQQVVFKRPVHSGTVFDFETQTVYSGYEPGKVTPGRAVIVEDGAGTGAGGHALSLSVDAETESSSVLLHPALPGEVDSIRMMVRTTGAPVKLQVWFVDSGFTGVWLLHHNLFWADEIEVNSAEWQEVVIDAPPIPAHYGDRNYYFFRKPWYPLNLAMNVTLVNKEAGSAALLVDNIHVVTHLAESAALTADIVYADETRIHTPGSPLTVALQNFSADARTVKVGYSLHNYHQTAPLEGAVDVGVAAASRQDLQLLPSLDPGMFDLQLTVDGQRSYHCLMVLDTNQALAENAADFITDPVNLRRKLGLMSERVNLDWDNTEPAPGVFHYDWFKKMTAKKTVNSTYQAVPVVGFCADWAGPAAVESMQDASYQRGMANLYQTPVRLVDWSEFVRVCLREYKGQFREWAFWENPDLQDSPQGLTADKYVKMLDIFHRWVKLYDPAAVVVANGFNFSHVLAFLDQIEAPHEMKFDRIAVQVNLGELSPEAADMEGFLDELERMLQLGDTGRHVQTAELDWGVGDYLTPSQQAAYHTRAALILNSRGALPHEYSLINAGFSFDGYGVAYRVPYGNTLELQGYKPFHVPKPAFFALVHVNEFLKDWNFHQAVMLPDRSLDRNRAFVYGHADGRLAVALWRTASGHRAFSTPEKWRGKIAVHDAFGFDIAAGDTLNCAELPVFVYFHETPREGDILNELRTLKAVDGMFDVITELHVSEPDSVRRHDYKATGELDQTVRAGVIPGGLRMRETFVSGISREEFAFNSPAAGNCLLRRFWYFESGQTLTVTLNGGKPMQWDLSPGQGNQAGIRESTLVLHGCRSGINRVQIDYETPGNSAVYRIEPMTDKTLDMARWGIINDQQSKGKVLKYRSAVGTPLRIGKQTFESGLGAHAVSFVEYPVNRQFQAFEVTVGIDGSTEGRGSAVFRIFADGKEAANSGVVNGFSKPQTLRLENIADVNRLVLSVMDAGDGDQHDLADWVDGVFYLKGAVR